MGWNIDDEDEEMIDTNPKKDSKVIRDQHMEYNDDQENLASKEEKKTPKEGMQVCVRLDLNNVFRRYNCIIQSSSERFLQGSEWW